MDRGAEQDKEREDEHDMNRRNFLSLLGGLPLKGREEECLEIPFSFRNCIENNPEFYKCTYFIDGKEVTPERWRDWLWAEEAA